MADMDKCVELQTFWTTLIAYLANFLVVQILSLNQFYNFAISMVLGKLGPGQLGPDCPGPNLPLLGGGQLGPGQLGPGAQLSGAQFATF